MKYFNENKQVIKAQSGTIIYKHNLRPVITTATQPYRSPKQETKVNTERNMYYDALRHFKLGNLDAQGLAETYAKYPKLKSYLKRIGMSENDFMSLAIGRAFENDSYERNRTKQFNRDIQKDQEAKANMLMYDFTHQDPNDRKLANIMTGMLTLPFASLLVAGPVASMISNPIRTGVAFAGGTVGGKGVDTYIQRKTDDNSFGEMMGRVTNTPELSGLYEFANPGYALGGWAANGLYGGLRGLRPGATKFISKVIHPETLALVVAATPAGPGVPIRINNNDRTQNILGLELHREPGRWGKPKTTQSSESAAKSTAKSTAESTATGIENETLADIRYRGNNRNKRVKVFAPGETKTISTIDGKTIDPSTLTIETKPTVDGHIVEEIVPGLEVSAQKWFMYEGRYRPETDIKKNTVTTPKTRVKFGEEVPEGSEFLNIKTGKLEPLEGKIFRTPQGWGRKSYIYYDGTPVLRYKNLGFYKQVGLPIAASIILFGGKNVYNKSKDVGKNIVSGDGIIGSIKLNNSQQTTPTTQTPEQTNNTFDAFNAADSTNIEEMRKEMELLGY